MIANLLADFCGGRICRSDHKPTWCRQGYAESETPYRTYLHRDSAVQAYCSHGFLPKAQATYLAMQLSSTAGVWPRCLSRLQPGALLGRRAEETKLPV